MLLQNGHRVAGWRRKLLIMPALGLSAHEAKQVRKHLKVGDYSAISRIVALFPDSS